MWNLVSLKQGRKNHSDKDVTLGPQSIAMKRIVTY